ncbi:hypothetical protein L210DRAFT_3522197 [Boletus edulis BED1]|uniref:Uncharacterized protein n=1 Tax=Boletus edulis BED1 TaxID=1328754 RepID=A0AAD4GMG7_BOLED|nr:hypothetical protein L210DRAFT_3522197 [Boletus edulis BED1]
MRRSRYVDIVGTVYQSFGGVVNTDVAVRSRRFLVRGVELLQGSTGRGRVHLYEAGSTRDRRHQGVALFRNRILETLGKVSHVDHTVSSSTRTVRRSWPGHHNTVVR